MPRLLIVIVIALCTLYNSFAQKKQGQERADSLINRLAYIKDDTNKVKVLNELCGHYIYTNQDQSIKYGLQSLDLASRLNFQRPKFSILFSIGRAYWKKADYQTALKFHFQAFELAKKSGNKNQIINISLRIGQDYGDGGNYAEALKYFSYSLSASKEANDKRYMAEAYGLLAWVYNQMGRYSEMIKYDYEALKIYEELGDTYGVTVCLTNLASEYETQGNYSEAIKYLLSGAKKYEEVEDFVNAAGNINQVGDIYLRMGNFEEAIKYQMDALDIGKKNNDKNIIGESYWGIANVYVAQSNYNEGLKYFLLAVNAFEEINAIRLSGLYTKIAVCYTKLGNFSDAQRYMNKAFRLSNTLNNPGNWRSYYEAIVQLDSAKSNWKAAFENYKRYIIYRDSLFGMDFAQTMTQTKMQYDFDKKAAAEEAERKIKEVLAKKELQRQKFVRNVFVGGFIVVLLFAATFFLQRNKIKQGKKLSDELLLNILPAEVAEELKTKGAAEAKLIDNVTVLFTDFKGFTQLSEKLSPKELVAEIHSCFSAFDQIIHKHGIEKIKTIGDAYMAAGGIPSPNNTHAVDVVSAALEIQNYMHQHKLERQAAGQLFFEVRIGIHTGPVVAGIVGVKKFQYDIWGDTVNTASRMESSGDAGKVNISEYTYELIKDKFVCTYRGEIDAKNKGMLKMYFVESVLA